METENTSMKTSVCDEYTRIKNMLFELYPTRKKNISEDANNEMGELLKLSAKYKNILGNKQKSELDPGTFAITRQTGDEIEKEVSPQLKDIF